MYLYNKMLLLLDHEGNLTLPIKAHEVVIYSWDGTSYNSQTKNTNGIFGTFSLEAEPQSIDKCAPLREFCEDATILISLTMSSEDATFWEKMGFTLCQMDSFRPELLESIRSALAEVDTDAENDQLGDLSVALNSLIQMDENLYFVDLSLVNEIHHSEIIDLMDTLLSDQNDCSVQVKCSIFPQEFTDFIEMKGFSCELLGTEDDFKHYKVQY